MKSNKTAISYFKPSIAFVTAFFLASALFFLCVRYDNRYTAKGPQPQNGVLTLTEESLAETPVLYLVKDWEIYLGKLLSPADFQENSAPSPSGYVFIGQNGSFEGYLSADTDPVTAHRYVTYRLNIYLPAVLQSYTLELPEIFSACRLYVNGSLLRQTGDLEVQNYTAKTDIGSITIQAANHMEILIAVADYSNISSGISSPPAFGIAQDVDRQLNLVLVIRTVIFSCAVVIGILYFLIGLLNMRRQNEHSQKNNLPFLYAVLCLCFSVYIGYPIFKTLFVSTANFYILRRLIYSMMLLLAILIQDILCKMNKTITIIFAASGISVCIWTIIAPLLNETPFLLTAYSYMVYAYAWLCAFYLTAGAAYGVYRRLTHNNLQLIGMAVLDASLVAERIFPLFKPVRFATIPEVAGGIFVLLLGILMTSEAAGQFRMQLAMEGKIKSVSRVLSVQRAYYPVLLQKESAERAMRHDLRHHITILRRFAEEGAPDKLIQYLDSFGKKLLRSDAPSYCRHFVVDMLLRMFTGFSHQQNISFFAQADLPESLAIEDVDLCVILSNILENALEASRRLPEEQRRISVRILCADGKLSILVQNRFMGSFQPENGRYASSKQPGREGIGLLSIESTVERYGGTASFYCRENNFFSEIVIPFACEYPPPPHAQ